MPTGSPTHIGVLRPRSGSRQRALSSPRPVRPWLTSASRRCGPGARRAPRRPRLPRSSPTTSASRGTGRRRASRSGKAGTGSPAACIAGVAHRRRHRAAVAAFLAASCLTSWPPRSPWPRRSAGSGTGSARSLRPARRPSPGRSADHRRSTAPPATRTCAAGPPGVPQRGALETGACRAPRPLRASTTREVDPDRLFARDVVGDALGRLGVEVLRIDPASHILGIRVNIWVTVLAVPWPLDGC